MSKDSHITLLKEQLSRLDTSPAQRFNRLILEHSGKRTAPRESAVMIVLYPASDAAIHLPFIIRPVYNGVHSGQIAFPGGKFEEGDPHLRATAIRETKEEVGIAVPESQVLGELSPVYIPPSHLVVNPVVAYLEEVPHFTPDPREVAGILQIALKDLRQPNLQSYRDYHLPNGRNVRYPSYRVHGHEVWGATARMLSELLHITRGISGL